MAGAGRTFLLDVVGDELDVDCPEEGEVIVELVDLRLLALVYGEERLELWECDYC